MVALGTINSDGSSHVTLLQFSLDESDRMYLPANRTTRKVKNILDHSIRLNLRFGHEARAAQYTMSSE